MKPSFFAAIQEGYFIKGYCCNAGMALFYLDEEDGE